MQRRLTILFSIQGLYILFIFQQLMLTLKNPQ